MAGMTDKVDAVGSSAAVTSLLGHTHWVRVCPRGHERDCGHEDGQKSVISITEVQCPDCKGSV